MSDNILEWGIFAYFRNDSVFVSLHNNNQTHSVFANNIYKQNTCYTLSFKFNNNHGEKGQYDFWITHRNKSGSVTYLGKYDFVVRHGKLKGVYEFVICTGDTKKNIQKKECLIMLDSQ
jgi:hypothetical protein